jgi:hippurate hydrolase
MNAVIKAVATAFDCNTDFKWQQGYPSTINTPAETAFARKVASEVLGADKVHEFIPMMGGEDFAYFLQACPGAYIIVGGGKTDKDPGLHSPHYDFNDETLPIGAAYWVRLAETWLK